ncbi:MULTISPECIES: hypothetical protein [unclassified Xanthomonas]|uniref:hypothetical protein n=1 Tax=unclassified Xanthomonas TaxID=2643310 RepID=UPI0011B07C88|nr:MULTISPECIES: hypothetical protein [unclassified Xanthomonas]
MAFVGQTEERKISTTNGKTYKIFLTEQVGGHWVATILYANSGVVTTHNEIAPSKAGAYKKASEWTLANIDWNASVESL